MDLIYFLLAIIFTEALTEIVVKSEIFSPLRAKIFKLGQNNKFFNWLHRLFDCGYCFSVWAGALVAFFVLELRFLEWFIVTLVLHRLSNLFHNFMDRVHGS
jgi:hypothetical protein